MSDEGPFLIIAAFWQDEDNTVEIAEAVSREKFPGPEGWPRGAVVSFRREVALAPDFQHDLRKFDLPELFLFPSATTHSGASRAQREDTSATGETAA